MKDSHRRFWLLGVLLATSVRCTTAAETMPDAKEPDLAALCFELATIQEPEVDVQALREKFTSLETALREALKGATTAEERVARMNRVLLAGRQVSYISNLYWRDSTLAASVLRGRGNCLSTTTLYVVMGQRLGLPVRAVCVPEHIFARYEDGETRINIETTAGGMAVPDETYHVRTPWTEADRRVLHHGESLSSRAFACKLRTMAASHLAQSQRFAEALQELGRAQALVPDQPALALQRLSLLLALNRQDEALQAAQALADRPPCPEIHAQALLFLGGHLHARGQHERALALLRVAYRVAPRYGQVVILSEMASCFRSLRRFPEMLAVQELSTVLHDQADDYVSLAIAYKNAERLADAIRCLEVAQSKNPESWNIRLILAGYLIRAGREADGWKAFKTVKKPRVSEDLYETNLAWFYGSIGRKAEFLEHLDRALALATGPHILNYIQTEVDFDRYRQDADFQQTVEKHRARLAGAGAGAK